MQFPKKAVRSDINAVSSYRSDEACSRLHCAQSSIPYFQRQDLCAGGHTVPLWLLREVTCSYAGDMSPMSTCKAKNSLMKSSRGDSN